MRTAKNWSIRAESIARLARADLDLNTLFAEVLHALGRVVPFDAACWHTLDPATLLETSHLTRNLPVENRLATEIEYLHEDYNQFATLARSPRHSGILSEATGGVPQRSRRYRELIRPFGLEGEVRVAFVTGGAAWGAAGLLRDGGDFTPEEAAFLQLLSEPLAEGVRRALLVEAAAQAEEAPGPGLVLLTEEGAVEAITAAAERLLGELADVPSGGQSRSLPYVVYAVAARARLTGRSAAPAQARVRTRAGRWLLLHGSVLNGPPYGRVAVIVEEASGTSMTPVIGQAYGLTAREAEVMQLLLQGRSTREIAAALYISPYTVQEHCRAIFDKVGVRSRRELVGRVFYQQYEPRRRTGLRPGPSGWFAEAGGTGEPADDPPPGRAGANAVQ
jgi:DNA-binding CsgD family transcriptional regulator